MDIPKYIFSKKTDCKLMSLFYTWLKLMYKIRVGDSAMKQKGAFISFPFHSSDFLSIMCSSSGLTFITLVLYGGSTRCTYFSSLYLVAS